MPAELDITAAFEAAPDDAPLWPVQTDKAVEAVGVAQGRYLHTLTLGRPATLHLGQQVHPFLILEGDQDPDRT